MNKPLVSVLMTAYNREKYIAEAIESVLASSYTDFELIIVDDGSRDSTVTIAREYAQKDDRIKLYVNEKNLQDYPNRNKAASYATGKYIKYLDSDDTIYPWGLESMVYCMEKCPEAGFGLMAINIAQDSPFPIQISGEAAYKAFFFNCALLTMGPSGSIIRRDVFEEAGGFSGKPYIGDLEIWLVLCKKYNVVCMPLDLIWWRQHEGQQVLEGFNNSYYQNNTFILYKRMLTDPDCPMSKEDAQTALRNQYNIRSRKVIIDVANLKLIKAFQFYRNNKLKPADIFKSIKKNKVIPFK
ncbi:MAG: glycosyltransferase family A protein [Ferruginibacter sp.]